MKIPPVKGTRDFYPAEMARRNWIVEGWRRASLRSGFEEYDGPIFEYLKMFQLKSGDEIVEQLFSFKDRGGRELALRPEITPTLARMVNQRINSLPQPIKWFSVPRLFRAERPQRGRLREFFQWNIDIIGVDDVLADAEVIFTTVDYLREVGLTPKDIKVKISSRKLLSAYLRNIGIPKDKLDSLYTLLDKYSKFPKDVFENEISKQVSDVKMVRKILDFIIVDDINEIDINVNRDIEAAVTNLKVVFAALETMNVKEYCIFDPSIVRGLAYYTGVVFEVHDICGELRAICGGGRYDNLLCDFGGSRIPATGMGMGDCVLELLLKEKGLLDKRSIKKQLDYFVACVDCENKPYVGAAIKSVMKLRTLGFSADFSYKRLKLGKQLKAASERNFKYCVIIGDEFVEKNEFLVKDMTTGEQKTIDVDKFFAGLKRN